MNKKIISQGVIPLVLVTTILLLPGCSSSSSVTSTANTTTSQQGSPPGAPPNSGSSTVVTGTATYAQSGQSVSKSNQTISATNSNQSGIKVSSSGVLTLSDSSVTTSGKTTSEDSSNFYGLNAAVLAESAGKITLTNTNINTSGNGANAAFATGSGSSVTLNNVKIKTTSDSSRGLDATQGGTVTATDVDISTAGAHCAALATDRGGGMVNVTGGIMTTAGDGSPGIYSTGKIMVSGAKLTATGSEAAVIEGRNSIALNNTTLSGAKKCGVMIYQSYSGDAEVGTGSFTMNGGSLTAAAGPLFYSTNTQAVIELKGAQLSAVSGTLLTAGADKWGTSGSNGATVTFKADSETLNGNITCDNISTIAATLQNNTTLNGAINTAKTAKSISLTLDKTSTWNVTGDSYLTSLADADSTLTNIHDNGHTIYYDSSNSANSWLNGKTVTLANGGKLAPLK